MNAFDDQEKHEERAKFGSEDSNVMTIEFLRARLQTERSISKGATRRADELAKRVVELEEHLRIAISQRQKAEEGTSNLLNFLKHRTLNTVSAVHDFSKKENPTDLNEKQESSNLCSEIESSCQTEASLTWNNTKNTSKAVEKSSSKHRRWNSVSSLPPATPQRSGKSCRQIRLSSRCDNDSEMVSLAESKEHEDREADKIARKKNDEIGLETAIMQRQLLIGQYEAMERVQTEWEKLNDSNSVSDISVASNENRMNPKEEFSFPTEKSKNPNPQIGKPPEFPLALVEKKKLDDVESILEALKQAKLCLKNKIVAPSPSPIRSLFRLPIGSISQERSQSLFDRSFHQPSFGKTRSVTHSSVYNDPFSKKLLSSRNNEYV